MERTYNVFVDNGLYICGYHLEKDIADINIQDLYKASELLADLYVRYSNTDYYSKHSWMGFHNSQYTQSEKFKDSEKRKQIIENQYKDFLDDLNSDKPKDYCTVCGKQHVIRNNTYTRSVMPNLTSNTFYNFSNNLKQINVCPICLFLAFVSIFNTRKAGNLLLLYLSDDNEFMEEHTKKIQDNVIRDIEMKKTENKEKTSSYKEIEKTITDLIDSETIYDECGYIQAIGFYNGQGQEYTEEHISKRDIDFVKNLRNRDINLYSEFKLKGLMRQLIANKLQKNYIAYIADIRKLELKVSLKLKEMVEEEYSMLTKKQIDTVKDICREIYDVSGKDEIKQLKAINSFDQFQGLIVKWIEDYADEKEKILMDTDTFSEIFSINKYKNVKNIMLTEFICIRLIKGEN